MTNDGSARWTWPAAVYARREVAVAEAVSSSVRHDLINGLAALANNIALLRRKLATSLDGERSAELSEAVERTGDALVRATTSLQTRRKLGATTTDSWCDLESTVLGLLRRSEAKRVDASRLDHASSHQVSVPAASVEVIVACLCDLLGASSGGAPTIATRSVDGSLYVWLDLLVPAPPGSSQPKGARDAEFRDAEIHDAKINVWQLTARHVLLRHGGALELEGDPTIAARARFPLLEA
ncbi:MAG: hypothetical protein R3A78_09020 [Polyangiales bacterium]|nr:hypothetical protein [Myxococcales bacterium]